MSFEFFGSQTVKNGRICIRIIKFIFKLSNLNLNRLMRKQHITTVWHDFNTNATDSTDRTTALTPTHRSTSP
jgi:hypothetical protein